MNGEEKKSLKPTYELLIAHGRETRFGPNWSGTRCGAKTRRGTLCLKPAIKNKTRCQLHGGRSTGAVTTEGLRNLSRIHLVHGRTRRKALARAQYYRNELKRLELQCRSAGLLIE